jgi:hypothetical protein
MASAFKAITGLTRLHISAPQISNFSSTLTSCHFSHLDTLEYALPASENTNMGKFMNRHPSIQKLIIYHCFYLLPSPIYDIKTPVHLPNLETLSAPANWVCLLVPNSKVSSVEMSWSYIDRSVASDVSSLAKSSRPVTTVASMWPGWNPDILAAFSRYLPDLTSLTLQSTSRIVDFQGNHSVGLAVSRPL